MDLGFEGNFSTRLRYIGSQNYDWIDKEYPSGWGVLKKTTFDTVFANDIKPSAKSAWVPYFKEKRNNDEAEFILGSIVDLVKSHKKGVFAFPEEIDIVTGGFPCQDFSVAGKRKGFSSHKCDLGNLLDLASKPTEENRGVLYKWMREVIHITSPKMFVAENVKGLVSLANVKEVIANDFSNIGNSGYLVVSPKVLHAARFGIPQTRERVFFIGFRKDLLKPGMQSKLENLEFHSHLSPYPDETHYLPSDLPLFKRGLNRFSDCAEAFTDLPEPENALDESQRKYSKAKYMGKHCQGQKEISLTLPSPTIRSEHHGNIEFRRLSEYNRGLLTEELSKGYQERRLTVRECARLQTFPDDFEFVRQYASENWRKLSATDGYKLIGNAVPPLLAYHLAKKIESLWNEWFVESANDYKQSNSQERIRAVAV